MICLLKNGHRVYYGGDKPKKEDYDKKLEGTLLCVIRYDGRFGYSFCWNDVVEVY
jgi:hypothetical protein